MISQLRTLAESDPNWGTAALIDVETTGLSPRRDEVIELAIVLFAYTMDEGRMAGVIERYAGRREPGVPIPRAATAVHGLTSADVQGCRLDEDRIAALIERADFLLAHNAAFDRSFVAPLFPTAARKPWRCSVHGVDWRRRGHRSRALQALLAAHGYRPERAHRGEADALSTLWLLGQSDRKGAPYFPELLMSRPLRPYRPPAPIPTALAKSGA